MLIHSEVDAKPITYLNTWSQPRPLPTPFYPQLLLLKLVTKNKCIKGIFLCNQSKETEKVNQPYAVFPLKLDDFSESSFSNADD